MNGVEERLREALRAQAEEFTAHPDAWRQLTARRRRRGGARWRWSRFSRLALIPLAAAAAVIAVVAAAVLVVHGVSGRTGTTCTRRAAADGPARQRRRGAVLLPGQQREPAGVAKAYLIHGAVGFWSPIWGGVISQRLAAGPPALGGLTQPFGSEGGGTSSPMEALGYAHADVARVVLRADGRLLASAATAAAGWPGSSPRLWYARVPVNLQQTASGRLVVTATAYDSAGHAVGQVQLGQMY